MKPPITTKAEYYRLAALGVLGNTLLSHDSLEDWERVKAQYPTWGVRTRTPGGPCSLNVPIADVPAAWERAKDHGPNISPMVSACIQTIWAGDLMDGPTGLSAHGLYRPPLGFDWRHEMKHNQKSWAGVRALGILNLMDGNSRDDFDALRDQYPGHVIEVSVFERCLGKLPDRNTIVWEVRAY